MSRWPPFLVLQASGELEEELGGTPPSGKGVQKGCGLRGARCQKGEWGGKKGGHKCRVKKTSLGKMAKDKEKRTNRMQKPKSKKSRSTKKGRSVKDPLQKKRGGGGFKKKRRKVKSAYHRPKKGPGESNLQDLATWGEGDKNLSGPGAAQSHVN